MTIEQRVDKLYNWAFVTNGIMSADKRIVDNTRRIGIVEDYPCKNGCVFLDHEEKEEEMNTRKRTFRIGDLANFIQLALLFLVVYQLFWG